MSRPLRLAKWLPAHQDDIAATLRKWVSIPSVAALPNLRHNLLDAAEFASQLMNDVGLRRATVIDSAGPPAAYAEWLGAGPQAPTVFVLGHLDVVPGAPVAEWTSPPFEPEVSPDGVCARGAVQGKGAALAAIESIHGLIESGATPEVNLKFLLHGEATIGSPNLKALLDAEADRVGADIVVVPVAGAGHDGRPAVLAGTRGLLLLDLEIRTADHDAATANFGGAIANPILVASRLAADLVDSSGRVALPGFYHRVRQLSERGRGVLASLDFDETSWRQVPGARIATGEAGFTALERLVARPSADVVAFTAGNRSEAAKAVVPAVATLRLGFGLVPDQRPDEIVSALRSWIEARLPRGVHTAIRVREHTRPGIAPVGQPAFAALVAATRRAVGSEPVLTRHGGTGPPDALADAFGSETPILLVPVGDASSRVNAPNERVSHQQMATAIHTFAELWGELENLGFTS